MTNDPISDILERGVAEVIDRAHLEKRLRAGEKLRVKLGIDPTSSNIHLGRAVALLKLRDFQELGHIPVLILGDFTGVIGDTSDKTAERPMLLRETVEENLKFYLAQYKKLLDLDKAEIHYNSKWLDTLSYREICQQADQFSLAEFMARKNIADRLEAGRRISLRELLYPLMQGYDSVAIKADVELGGTDQRFNLLAGRAMQAHYSQEPQDIMTVDLIPGTDGRKMSSSWGNTINLTDEPKEMYGKMMSMRDEDMISYLIHCTRVLMNEVEEIKRSLASGTVNPRDIKMQLAFEITKIYWGEEGARAGEAYFKDVFQKGDIPGEMPEIEASGQGVASTLVITNFAKSKTDARRLLEEGAVRVNGEVVRDGDVILKKGAVLQKGKREFVRIK